jgi:hypothetical protein
MPLDALNVGILSSTGLGRCNQHSLEKDVRETDAKRREAPEGPFQRTCGQAGAGVVAHDKRSITGLHQKETGGDGPEARRFRLAWDA